MTNAITGAIILSMKHIQIGTVDTGAVSVVDLFATAQDEAVAAAWDGSVCNEIDILPESATKLGSIACGKCMYCDDSYLYS